MSAVIDKPRAAAAEWRPGAHNLALMLVQLILLGIAAARGLDYLQPRPDGFSEPGLSAVEQALPLPVWGAGLLLAGTLGLVGIAAHRAGPLILAHLMCWAAYGGLGIGILMDRGIDVDGRGILGILLIGAGLGVIYRAPLAWVRILVGVPLTVSAQWLLAIDLGPGYRTGTGLAGSALIHAVLAVGTVVLWNRQRARAVVDAEQGKRGDL